MVQIERLRPSSLCGSSKAITGNDMRMSRENAIGDQKSRAGGMCGLLVGLWIEGCLIAR